MQNLVGSIIACLPMLLDVIILISFYFIIFGIMTVQLFGGVLRNRCGVPIFDEATTDAATGVVHVGCCFATHTLQLAGAASWMQVTCPRASAS